MKAAKQLPDNYSLAWAVDVEKDKGQMWLLQILGLPWSIVVLVLLVRYVFWLRPEIFTGLSMSENSIVFYADEALLGVFLAMLPVLGITIILHELVHGFFFWLFTRERPKFGYKFIYAYATAPGWYFATSHYWLIGLAPLVLLTVLGLALVPFVAQPLAYLLIFALFTNASGAIGDLYIVTRLAFEPAGTLVEDQGTGFRVFRRVN